MVDRDKIEGLIRQLRQYTGYLQEIVGQDREEFLKDPKSVGSTRYYLQVSIETCIGIANHVIATDRLRAPQDYKDSFSVLNETGILPIEFTRTMRELAGLRNLLVHLYWDVDDQVIYEAIRSELSDFETFVGYILAYMDKA
jgi:uncharacterized protein YutE (UPF0331/DUF86 family)